MTIYKKNFYFLTALLLFLSFPSFDFFLLKGNIFFAWIAFVPLFVFVREKTLKKVYFVSFLTGLFANFVRFYWVGFFAAEVNGGFILLNLLLIPFLSIFFALRIFLAELFSRSFEHLRFIIYPSVWIIFDWLISSGFVAFPLGYIGNTQYSFTPFIQIAAYIGVLGINFIIMMANVLLADFIYNTIGKKLSFKNIFSSSSFKRMLVFTGAIIIIIFFGYSILAPNKYYFRPEIKVSVVQSCISPWEDWNHNKFKYLEDLKIYTEKSLKEKPDFIIWSESATLETLSYHYFKNELSNFDEELLKSVQKWGKPLFTGEIGVVTKKSGYNYPQNNVALINNLGHLVSKYSKMILVTFGEWFPYAKWFPGLEEFIIRSGGSNFIPGEKQEVMSLDIGNKTYRFAPLICYEGTFPDFCRRFANKKIDFFINASNDGWTDSYAGHTQHFSASIFRAIENGKWLIRAGNTGYTAIIDPYGRIKSSLPILDKNYLVDDLHLKLNHSTFYLEYGDLLLYCAVIFILIISVRGVSCAFFLNS